MQQIADLLADLVSDGVAITDENSIVRGIGLRSQMLRPVFPDKSVLAAMRKAKSERPRFAYST